MDAPSSSDNRLLMEAKAAEALIPALDTGDLTVRNLLYFSQPFSQIPIKVMAVTLIVIIWETLIISVSTMGSQLMVVMGFMSLNYMENTEGQAALGIAFSFNLVFFYGYYLSLVDKLGIDCSQTFGAKQYYKTKVVTNKALWMCIITYLCFTVPCFLLSVPIMTFVKVDPAIAPKVRDILMILLGANLLELTADFLRAFCMAQGFEQVFGTTSLLAVVISSSSAWIFVVAMDLGVIGWVYSKIIYELICVVCAWVIFQITHNETRGFASISVVKEGFGSYFLESIKFAIGSYTEFIGIEITSLFVFYTHDNEQIAAYTSMLNFTSIFYSMGESFSVICRTRMNLLIGKDLKKTAKNFYIFFIFGVMLFGILMSGGVFLMRDLITEYFAGSNDRMTYYFYYILTVYCLALPSELSITTSFIGVKTIGSIVFLMMLNSVIYIACNTLFCYLATKYYNAGAIMLFAGLQGQVILMNLVCIAKVTCTNWEKAKLVIEDEMGLEVSGMAEEEVVVNNEKPKELCRKHTHTKDKEVTERNNLVLY